MFFFFFSAALISHRALFIFHSDDGTLGVYQGRRHEGRRVLRFSEELNLPAAAQRDCLQDFYSRERDLNIEGFPMEGTQ